MISVNLRTIYVLGHVTQTPPWTPKRKSRSRVPNSDYDEQESGLISLSPLLLKSPEDIDMIRGMYV